MITVQAIFFANSLSNYSYLIWGGKNICVDPFDGPQVYAALAGRKLDYIINTHQHFDHIQGNEFLVERCGAEVVNPLPGEHIDLGDCHHLEIIYTPGHTMDHIGLLLWHKTTIKSFFAGDTLFNGGVGNCKSGGSPEVLFETIRNLLKLLPDSALLYPGHNYYVHNVGFADSLNLSLRKNLEYHEWMSIGDEKSYNPFLMLFDQTFLAQLVHLKIIDENCSEKAFLRLRELRNHY